MQELDDKEVRQIQLQILEYVAQFCETNGIRYWLDFGTLLGAVRHKGYIPWDDDIDVGMLRTDYERFMKLFHSENDRYRFFCPEKDDNYYYVSGKVADMDTELYEPDRRGNKLAVNIDVFVYDNAPDEKTAMRIYNRTQRRSFLNMLQHNLIADRGKWYRKIVKRVMSIILMPFPKNLFVKMIAADARRYDETDSGKIGLFSWSDHKILLDKNLVTDFTEVEFEGRMFKAPKQYDVWLTKIYGDYMKFPPKEEQITHHVYEAYRKNG